MPRPNIDPRRTRLYSWMLGGDLCRACAGRGWDGPIHSKPGSSLRKKCPACNGRGLHRRTVTIAQPGRFLTVDVRSNLTDADLRAIARDLCEYIKAVNRRKHRPIRPD